MAANPWLVEKYKITAKGVLLINGLHLLRERYASLFLDASKDMKEQYLYLFDEIEFTLQDLWGFERDKKFHKFWELPGCECPKMDNDDAYPHGRYIYSLGCPIHKYIKLINDTSKESTDGDNNNGTNSTTEEVLP